MATKYNKNIYNEFTTGNLAKYTDPYTLRNDFIMWFNEYLKSQKYIPSTNSYNSNIFEKYYQNYNNDKVFFTAEMRNDYYNHYTGIGQYVNDYHKIIISIFAPHLGNENINKTSVNFTYDIACATKYAYHKFIDLIYTHLKLSNNEYDIKLYKLIENKNNKECDANISKVINHCNGNTLTYIDPNITLWKIIARTNSYDSGTEFHNKINETMPLLCSSIDINQNDLQPMWQYEKIHKSVYIYRYNVSNIFNNLVIDIIDKATDTSAMILEKGDSRVKIKPIINYNHFTIVKKINQDIIKNNQYNVNTEENKNEILYKYREIETNMLDFEKEYKSFMLPKLQELKTQIVNDIANNIIEKYDSNYNDYSNVNIKLDAPSKTLLIDAVLSLPYKLSHKENENNLISLVLKYNITNMQLIEKMAKVFIDDKNVDFDYLFHKRFDIRATNKRGLLLNTENDQLLFNTTLKNISTAYLIFASINQFLIGINNLHSEIMESFKDFYNKNLKNIYNDISNGRREITKLKNPSNSKHATYNLKDNIIECSYYKGMNLYFNEIILF